MNTECIALSNNGRIVAVQIDTDTVVICDLTGYCSPSEEEQTRLRGSGFRISPDSDAIAIWRNDEIVIYNGIIAGRYYDSPLNPLDVVSSTTVHGASHSWRGVWSEDSRWLAFSDEQGLWLWDVFTQPPTLLLPTESDYIPYARFFSNSGRYLGVSTADGNLILDLQSDLIFPDGIIAPDERHLITVDTVTNQLVVAEQCDLLTDHCEEVCANTDVTPMIYGAQWYSNLPLEWEPRLLVCNQEGCSPNYQFPYDICTASPTANNIVYFRETGAFTADVISTIQVGDYEVESDYMGPSLSLEDSIDSPILDIRWPS
jgi:hypothetical protein